jgi:hypothetical protein
MVISRRFAALALIVPVPAIVVSLLLAPHRRESFVAAPTLMPCRCMADAGPFTRPEKDDRGVRARVGGGARIRTSLPLLGCVPGRPMFYYGMPSPDKPQTSPPTKNDDDV